MTCDPTVEPVEAPALIELRADADGARALGEALGVALPASAPHTVSQGTRTLLRLGPDRWWLLAPAAEEASLHARLLPLEQSHHVMSVALSDAFTCFRLRGTRCADVLAQGTGIDGDALPPGGAVRSALAKTVVVLHRRDAGSVDLYVETPLARYLNEWLARARDTLPPMKALP